MTNQTTRAFHVLSRFCAVFFLVAASAATARAFGMDERDGPALPQPRPLAPGVRIDWPERKVEVDATIVLRDGPLELFACSKGTREHESILVISASPTHVYQALGLIGLEPGSPVRYDTANNRFVPPTGAQVEIRVRYEKDGETRTVSPEDWLLSASDDKTVDAVRWVFAGSRTGADNRLTVEDEGTVITLVDFDSALITADGLHSADNDALWVIANTRRIPPVGTSCKLILQATTVILRIKLDRQGKLTLAGQPRTAKSVAEQALQQNKSGRRIEIRINPTSDTAHKTIEDFIKILTAKGIDRESIRVDKGGSHGSDSK